MDIEKLIEQLNDWNEKYISNLCGDRTIKCEEYCIKDDCLIVKAATALSTLQGENETLRAELDHLRSEPGQELWSEENQRADRLAAEMERARKDNKRLCAAMMTIRKSENLERMCVVYEMDYAAVLSHDFVQDIARIVFDGLMLEDLKRRGQKED